MTTLANLEALLAKGQDTALLRYSLGNEYLKIGDLDQAIAHLAAATRLDPRYSAAWKLHGKALQAAGRAAEALTAFDQGIAVAEERGDIQAVKEMRVFHKRAEKDLVSYRLASIGGQPQLDLSPPSIPTAAARPHDQSQS